MMVNTFSLLKGIKAGLENASTDPVKAAIDDVSIEIADVGSRLGAAASGIFIQYRGQVIENDLRSIEQTFQFNLILFGGSSLEALAGIEEKVIKKLTPPHVPIIVNGAALGYIYIDTATFNPEDESNPFIILGCSSLLCR